MSEIGEFFVRHLGAVIVFELAAVAVLVYAILKEEQLKAFEDRLIKALRHRIRRAVFKARVVLRGVARRVFIKVYGAYRRHRIARYRRLARSVGCEVRSMREGRPLPYEEGVVHEILSRR